VNMRHPLRPALALLLVLAAATLAACGSSTTGLIPAENASPLKSDFEEVAQAALAGDGNCGATDEALAKTEQDFAALPASVNAGLRKTLQVGIENLSTRARVACTQPLASATTTTATKSTTSSTTTTTTSSTPTTTSTTTTSSTATTTPSVTTTPGVGGGTQAPPGESGGGAQGNGQGNGQSNGQGNGLGNGSGNAGESGAGAGGAGAAPSQGAEK
jgi:hypothetical protein